MNEKYNTINHHTVRVKNKMYPMQLVKWVNNIYIDVTKIYHIPGSYTSKMDLCDVLEGPLLNITYSLAQPREKN